MSDTPRQQLGSFTRKHDPAHHTAHFAMRACPMCGEPPTLLALDDITLIPHERSSIRSRSGLSVESVISPRISLKIPVCSSYMDTVTEAPMATAMARFGGLGFIHRLMSVEQQAEQVERVKRALSRIIERPYTIGATATLLDYTEATARRNVSTFLVVDGEGVLVGIISRRDFHRAGGDLEKRITEVMTPRDQLVVAKPGASQEEIGRLFNTPPKPEQIPLVDRHNTIKGLISAKSWYDENPDALVDAGDNLIVGACIGLNEDFTARTGAILDAGADVVILAIANGYMGDLVDATLVLRQKFGDDFDLIVGDVAEYEGAKALFRAGADTVAVGIGPGSICVTRMVAGVGAPLWSSLRSAARAAREEGKYILCDGGIREPHHLNKALYAGASAVIMGSPLAGTDESPGELIEQGDGRKLKFQHGLASDGAKRKQREVQGQHVEEDDSRVSTYIAPEGLERAFVPYAGPVLKVLRRLVGGLRSSMSYMGARDLEEFWDACDKGYFGRQTPAGFAEGNTHSVIVDEHFRTQI